MALQLFKIADVAVTSPVSSIAFSSIPSTYTDLLVKVSTRTDRNTGGWTEIWFRVNNNTSAVYSTKSIYGSGSLVYNNSTSGATYAQIAEKIGRAHV